MLGLTSEARIRALLEALIAQDAPALFAAIQQLAQGSPDYAEVLAELLALLHAIAVVQLMPEADAELFEASPQLVREFAPRLSPEAVQLYYQIALHGRRDLPLAPSPRMGLEMTLLRMLAFVPAEAGVEPGSMRHETPRAPLPSPAAGEAAPVVRAQPESRPNLRPPQGPDQVRVRAAVEEAPPTAASTDAPQPLEPSAWHALLPRLGLRGPALMLAENSELVAQEGDLIRLRCPPSHASLRTQLAEDSIRKALSKRLGMEVRLRYEEGHPAQDTPAQLRRQQEEARQQEAVTALKQDPVVRKLEERLDARLLEESVRPLDPI